jgi:histidinol-phosphate aminotransferase
VRGDLRAGIDPVLPGAMAVSWSQRPDTSGILNLKSCELQTPAAEALLAEALQALEPSDFWRYPYQMRVVRQLASDYGVSESSVMLSAGSSVAIGSVVDALALPRGRLVLQEPIFDSWTYFGTLRGVPTELCPGVTGIPPATTVEAFQAALRTSPPAVAAITNPGNPLGDLLPIETVREIAELAADHGHLLVVDDCYGAFHGTRHADLVNDYANVLVIRSMSKAWALAGARLAVVLGSPSLIAYLQRFRLDSAVSGPALAVASRLCELPSQMRAVRAELADIRDWFVDQMRDVRPDWSALPSVTNFVTFYTGAPGGGDKVEALLKRHRIRVRSVESIEGLAGCVRISLAGRHAMGRVLEVLASEPGTGDAGAV